MKRTLFCAALLCIVALAVPCAMAQNVRTKIVDADSLAYGRTYSEWAAALEQWADSIPAAQHPLMDNGDCSVGQSGPVWFLAGKFCALTDPNCGTSNVVRHCNVPAGKALFIEVIGGENSTLETPSLPQIQDLRANMAGFIDNADATLVVDGFSVPQIKAALPGPIAGICIHPSCR